MRPTAFLAPLLLLAACSAQAETAKPQVSSQQCEVRTSYDVLADSGGIWLRRKQGVPREIFSTVASSTWTANRNRSALQTRNACARSSTAPAR